MTIYVLSWEPYQDNGLVLGAYSDRDAALAEAKRLADEYAVRRTAQSLKPRTYVAKWFEWKDKVGYDVDAWESWMVKELEVQ
jgi:hypothetical protein